MVDTANSECQFSSPGLIRGLIWGQIWMLNVKPVSQPFYYIVINILVTSSEILWKFWNFWNFEIFWKFWNLMKSFEKLKCLKLFLLIMVFFDFLWWVMHLLASGHTHLWWQFKKKSIIVKYIPQVIKHCFWVVELIFCC
jgi:hypothetical protein